jgi:hypothetical protein
MKLWITCYTMGMVCLNMCRLGIPHRFCPKTRQCPSCLPRNYECQTHQRCHSFAELVAIQLKIFIPPFVSSSTGKKPMIVIMANRMAGLTPFDAHACMMYATLDVLHLIYIDRYMYPMIEVLRAPNWDPIFGEATGKDWTGKYARGKPTQSLLFIYRVHKGLQHARGHSVFL